MTRIIVLLLLISPLLLPIFLQANDQNSSEPAGKQTDRQKFSYSIGFGVADIPYFDVGGSSKVRVIPYGDLRYGSFFLSPMKGIGFDVRFGGGFVFSPAIGFRTERKEDDHSSLNGTGNIDADATYGAWIGYMSRKFMAGAKIFRGFDDGTIYAISAGVPIMINKEFAIIPGVSAQYNDETYNKRYYGIDSTQSAQSGYAEYAPTSGWSDISFSTLFNYKITNKFSVNLFGRYKRFVDRAEKSPIVQANDKEQTSFGILFIYGTARGF